MINFYWYFVFCCYIKYKIFINNCYKIIIEKCKLYFFVYIEYVKFKEYVQNYIVNIVVKI